MAEESGVQIYSLIKQWASTTDSQLASQALQQIALSTGCVRLKPDHWSEEQSQSVVQWLREKHSNAYLLALSQRCVGHPAIVWGNSMQSPALRTYLQSSLQ